MALLVDIEAVPEVLAVVGTQLCFMTAPGLISNPVRTGTLSDNAFANPEVKA